MYPAVQLEKCDACSGCKLCRRGPISREVERPPQGSWHSATSARIWSILFFLEVPVEVRTHSMTASHPPILACAPRAWCHAHHVHHLQGKVEGVDVVAVCLEKVSVVH